MRLVERVYTARREGGLRSFSPLCIEVRPAGQRQPSMQMRQFRRWRIPLKTTVFAMMTNRKFHDKNEIDFN